MPSLSTEGLALRAIGSVELSVGANPSGGFNVDQWLAGAKRIETQTPPQPGPFHVQIPASGFIGKEMLAMVRVGNSRGRMSAWSNIFPVNVEMPLAKPSDFQAQPSLEGVRLSWNAPNENSFRVFRKLDQEKEPTPLATTDKPQYLHASTEYTQPYQ